MCNSLDSVVVGGRPDQYHEFALILLELTPGSLFLLKGGYLGLSTYSRDVFALYCVVLQESQLISDVTFMCEKRQQLSLKAYPQKDLLHSYKRQV